MVKSAEYEAPPGPGYWKASDGHWYPPESQPGHQSAPSVVYVQQAPRNGQAVAALVCGITGVVLGTIPILAVPALILGIVALTFGWLSWRRALHGQPRKGMAVWGTVLGIVAVGLSIVGFVIVNNAFSNV